MFPDIDPVYVQRLVAAELSLNRTVPQAITNIVNTVLEQPVYPKAAQKPAAATVTAPEQEVVFLSSNQLGSQVVRALAPCLRGRGSIQALDI